MHLNCFNSVNTFNNSIIINAVKVTVTKDKKVLSKHKNDIAIITVP